MSTIKQGSVMEGIFAMYCAAYLIDPADGQNKKSIENFIDDLRVDTTLGRLIDKTKRSVDYNNTFPANAKPAKKHFKSISIVKGNRAKIMIRESEKFKILSKVLKDSTDYFESIGVKGFLDFSQVELKVRVSSCCSAGTVSRCHPCCEAVS